MNKAFTSEIFINWMDESTEVARGFVDKIKAFAKVIFIQNKATFKNRYNRHLRIW